MGMIYQAAGDRRRAEDCFQKTVYLDPSHDEALLALACLLSAAVTRAQPPASAAVPNEQRPVLEASELRWRNTRQLPDSSDMRLSVAIPGRWRLLEPIGVSGDRSCPELNSHIHCRNCPVFAGAARPSSTELLPRVISRIGRDGWLNQPASTSRGN